MNNTLKKLDWSKILTKKFLIREYNKYKKSMRQIAKEIGCYHSIISKYLKKYNIPLRKNNTNYIDGRTKATHYCTEKGCNKQICYSSWKQGQGRCRKCAGKIHSKKMKGFIPWNKGTAKTYYCKEPKCKNKISYVNWKSGSGRCRPCTSKEKYELKMILKIPKPKKCLICNNIFYPNTNGKLCSNKCRKKHQKNYLKKNKKHLTEQKKKYDKVYRKNNQQKIKQYQDKYNKTHIKQRKKYDKKNYLLNKSKKINQVKQYRIKNKSKIKKYKKRYGEQNKEHLLECRKIWMKNKRKTDVRYKLTCNLRKRIYSAVKENSKSKRTVKLIGCSIDKLKQHLEKQFKLRMTWDNYGHGWNGGGMKEWHIDHIKPCCSFNLSKANEQKKCFNYKNLQPLWAKENLKKSKKC